MATNICFIIKRNMQWFTNLTHEQLPIVHYFSIFGAITLYDHMSHQLTTFQTTSKFNPWAESISCCGSIYILGGNLSDESFRVTTHDRKCTALQRMFQRKFRISLCAFKTHIFVVGGISTEANLLRDCDTYSITTSKWRKSTPLNFGKSQCALCLFQKKFLYAISGFAFINRPYSIIERLNLLYEKQWHVMPIKNSELIQIANIHALQIGNSEILVFGGGMLFTRL